MMKRFWPTATALFAIAVWVWLAMMLTHEFGHVLAAWVTGGVVTSLELRPGYLSHTLVDPSPRPSVVLFGGFLFGWLAPQLTVFWWQVRAGHLGAVLRAWAAFCLLAGGSYLAIGGTERLTDTGQLVRAGWPLPLLIAIGLGVATLGYMRSRSAWIAVANRLEAESFTWCDAGGWWGWLVVWCVAQTGLHQALEAWVKPYKGTKSVIGFPASGLRKSHEKALAGFLPARAMALMDPTLASH